VGPTPRCRTRCRMSSRSTPRGVPSAVHGGLVPRWVPTRIVVRHRTPCSDRSPPTPLDSCLVGDSCVGGLVPEPPRRRLAVSPIRPLSHRSVHVGDGQRPRPELRVPGASEGARMARAPSGCTGHRRTTTGGGSARTGLPGTARPHPAPTRPGRPRHAAGCTGGDAMPTMGALRAEPPWEPAKAASP